MGTFILIAGLVVVLAAGYAVAVRPVPGAPAWLRLDRLRLARAQLAESVGALGSFVFLLGGGVLVVTAAGVLFGLGVASLEHPVDWWAFHLSDRLRSPGLAHVMNVLTRMGNLFQTRVAAVVCSVLLALVAWRRRWWGPAVLILGVVVVEKYQQSMLATIVDRGHPPTTLGTYPSGGCARLISVYGVIIFAVLELTRAGRRTRVAAWTVLSAAAFTEGFSRWYLNKHWVTDVLGGWFYGTLLLMVALFAGRALIARNDRSGPVTEERVEPARTSSRT